MTLMRETPKTTAAGGPRPQRQPAPLGHPAGSLPRKNGRRCSRHRSTVQPAAFSTPPPSCGTTTGNGCNPKGKPGASTIPITEEAAVQIRLLLDALGGTERADKSERLARAIADLHPCESSWWYACHKNRNRPRRVLDALTLMYA